MLQIHLCGVQNQLAILPRLRAIHKKVSTFGRKGSQFPSNFPMNRHKPDEQKFFTKLIYKNRQINHPRNLKNVIEQEKSHKKSQKIFTVG